MKATYRILTAAERAALNGDEVAAQNSAALEEMMSRYPQGIVQADDDLVPAHAAEEGLPLRGRNEFVTLPDLPHDYNGTGQIGIYSGGL